MNRNSQLVSDNDNDNSKKNRTPLVRSKEVQVLYINNFFPYLFRILISEFDY